MSAQMTRAPLRANSSTVALPIPDAPPVTSAVLPSSFMGALLSCVECHRGLTGEKRRDAFPRLGIGRTADASPRARREYPRSPGSAAAAMHFLLATQRGGRQAGDPLRDLGGARRAISARGDRPLRDAEPRRLRAVDDFGAENEARGDRPAAQSRQPLRSAGAGNQSEARLGQADLGLERRRCADRRRAPVRARRPWRRRRSRPASPAAAARSGRRGAAIARHSRTVRVGSVGRIEALAHLARDRRRRRTPSGRTADAATVQSDRAPSSSSVASNSCDAARR